MNKNYNQLSEGEQRLAVVKFEMIYGDEHYEHNLLNLAMSEVNPVVFQTSDFMYGIKEDSQVEMVKNAAVALRKKHSEIRKSLGL